MLRFHFLYRVLICALLACSCSIEIDQAVETPQLANTPAISSTSIFSMTPVPITWAHLNLTGKLIYLSSKRDNDIVTGNIQMLDLVSGEIATIFSVPGAWIYYATISPDAKSVVMSYAPPAQANSSPNRILYIMPLDTAAAPQPLFTPPTQEDRYTQVEWSADGRYLYFVHYNNEARPSGQLDPIYDILRIQYPAGQLEQIADHAFWPRLSSNSSQLVYISVDPVSGKNELFTANADGSNPQRVALSGPASQKIIDAPIFSPDGQSILFSVPSLAQSHRPNWFEKLMGVQGVKAHNVPSDWWSVPVTGGVPAQLTNIQTVNLFASISPDQKHIASLSAEGIFVMDLQGSNLTRLVADSGVHGTVSWTP